MKHHARDRRAPVRARARLGSVLVATVLLGLGFAQTSWEMRVCAQPHDPPMSSREDGGFNNRIAEILADELGAELTFEWTNFDAVSIERTLLSGSCDVVVGIGEDVAGVASTIPYLRAPYVFVTLADRNLRVTSLDDESLRDLRIGTYQTGVPSLALRNRGIESNVIEYPPVATPGGPDRDAAILDALVAGEVDVAIVYGPAAAHRDRIDGVDLELEPVTPEVDVGQNLIQLFRIWTLGVRPHDEAFRDRLNVALAARWDDVRAAIDAFGVPQADIPRPAASPPTARRSVGLVLPTPSGGQVPLADIGMAAWHGAHLAENAIARDEARSDEDFRVLFASAPTHDAAVRAGERLVATEDVFALVGGFDEERARSLGRIADGAGILFMNIASIAQPLREDACLPGTFHVEASEAMYLDALVDGLADDGARSFFVVHEASDRMASLAERADARLRERGDGSELVGRAAVQPKQFVYLEAVAAIEEAEPDAVLVLLGPSDQEVFLTQLPRAIGATTVSGLSFPLTQTRRFLDRFRNVRSDVGLSRRVALWEASIDRGDEAQINERFVSRTGVPMDPTAWASYAAVRILFEASSDAAGAGTQALRHQLVDEATTFDLGKGVPLSFRAWNRQMRQPLYAVRVDPDAAWSRSVRDQVAIAELVDVRPVRRDGLSSDERLDQLGVDRDASTCAR